MPKGGNIKYQLFQAIDRGFKPGRSKHSEMDKHHDIVYSYSDRNALRDTASDFAKYLKTQHVRKLIDITPENCSDFLKSKEGKISDHTMKVYKSRLIKLGKLSSNYTNHRCDFRAELPKNNIKKSDKEKIRTLAMKDTDLKKALSYINPKSEAHIALRLSRSFGLRVSETTHIRPCDIRLKDGRLFIHRSKGGRSRVLFCHTTDQFQVLSELKAYGENKGIKAQKPILTIKNDSVNRALQRALDKVYGKDKNPYRDHATGVHSIRKRYATERYHELRLHMRLSQKQAFGIVSKELGHSANRTDLFEVYIVEE